MNPLVSGRPFADQPATFLPRALFCQRWRQSTAACWWYPQACEPVAVSTDHENGSGWRHGFWRRRMQWLVR